MKNLKALMKKQNMDEAEFCFKSGIKVNTLRGYLSGKRNPSLASARKIAKFLGVTTEDLG